MRFMGILRRRIAWRQIFWFQNAPSQNAQRHCCLPDWQNERWIWLRKRTKQTGDYCEIRRCRASQAEIMLKGAKEGLTEEGGFGCSRWGQRRHKKKTCFNFKNHNNVFEVGCEKRRSASPAARKQMDTMALFYKCPPEKCEGGGWRKRGFFRSVLGDMGWVLRNTEAQSERVGLKQFVEL